MLKTIEATFDGQVLRFDKPLTLAPNTRVRVTIETLEPTPKRASFLDTALSLQVKGPPDWAENLDAYLYGLDDPHET